MTLKRASARRRRDDEGEPPFRPTRRFTKPKPKNTRRFKPGWFELVMELLRSYAARNGTTCVPAQHREGNFHLGWMVVYLRARYRQGLLSAERAHKLERLHGWSWDVRQKQFQEGLALLKRFARREGHADVPSSHREQGFRLGLWVDNLRARHRRGALARHKFQALKAIRGWNWQGELGERRFHQVLHALRQLVARQGRFHVPRNHRASGINLDRWVVLKREAYHQRKLPRTRARALEAVPGWSWQPRQDRFEEGLRLLRRFLDRHGNCRVPQDRHGPGSRLGLWVMSQRQRYRKGRLSNDRVRCLEKLPGWTWNARKDTRRPA